MNDQRESARLGPQQRARDLKRMTSEVFDVVVIGGGVTGTGTALDAVTRGLSTALIEQRDYASGTSSRSSKLLHGGLRYLEQMNFKLVAEALRERNLMLNRLCPHLARPVSFLYPLQHRVWERAYVGAGIMLYDMMASAARTPMPHHRHLSKKNALALAPSLDEDSLVGGIVYWDAQVDDARHTMNLARTAEHHGAALAPSARATGFAMEGDRVVGVEVRDLESGEELFVRARHVINTTGVWVDQVQSLAGRDRNDIRASKGVHLVVPRDRIRGETGMILRTDQSVLFVIPWNHHWIIGTTDTDWNLDLAHPAASQADIDYLLDNVNKVLAEPLTEDDVEGVYAGLRPLMSGESEATSKVSREHLVLDSAPGLTSVVGGKYTTYRVMASDAVDRAASALTMEVPTSTTKHVRLVGADGYEGLWDDRERLAPDLGLDISRTEHLLRRYGTLVHQVFDVIRGNPVLAEPMAGAEQYLAVELVYAASHEGALHLDDVLTRRTRISIETADRGVMSARPAAVLMGKVLGWDEITIDREVDHYLARVAAELDSQEQQDDHTADAARLGAPDVRMDGR
ncbi:MAG: glycerol-3-phosphate dehydrogenase/oxidase [Actinomycetota bacterium]|nr:glycerol-3-phosphate dehydrogenase/oxidase [Actinomycetota bacterium]